MTKIYFSRKEYEIMIGSLEVIKKIAVASNGLGKTLPSDLQVIDEIIDKLKLESQLN